MQKINKKQEIFVIISILTVILLSIFTTYAFFTSNINNNDRQTAELTNGTMRLRFADNDNGIYKTIRVGETVTKKFTIENTGNLETSLGIEWYNLVNTYLNGSLTYKLLYSSEENGDYEVIVPDTNVPTTKTPMTITLASEISVPAGKIYYYNLEITYNNTDYDQQIEMDSTFSTKFNVGNPSKYKNYLLRINPNGGTWNEFTSTQEYLLKNNETMEIEAPIRYGYNFENWEIQGISYEFDNNTFSMGISDTYLKAIWSPKKVDVLIDGTNEQVEFGDTITLEPKDMEGYTFGGWDVTGGILEGNEFTINAEENITITPKYIANDYKYIVYHNKMNTDGIGYTLVDADTDEGEAKFNTTITPEVKTYTGFTSPERKSLTIQAETVYPPVKNKIDYNYTRNKYTLTLNIDGTTTTEEIFYGQTKELVIPEKEGYNFTNWSGKEEYIHDNILTMPNEDMSISANFIPKTFSITFNANGGTVSQESQVVTYDQEYGELPIPVYEGYQFLGWYTSLEGGEKISETDIVKISGNITLFAHFQLMPLMMARDDTKQLWSNATKITKIVFEQQISAKTNATYSEDISEEQNNSVMSYLVPNGSNYVAYIQANGKVLGNSNSKALFSGFSSLQTIEGFKNFDTSNVTTMWDMFSGCTSLTSLDLSNFDTSKVTDMLGMFAESTSLTVLDLRSFDTSQVTRMGGMFNGCSGLTTLYLTSFSVEKVENFNSMFKNCSSLTNLDLNNFITSSATTMIGMFQNCYKLTSLDLSSFDTSNVTSMSSMFSMWGDGSKYQSSLTSITFSEKFTTTKVTSMSSMFNYCNSLKSLDLHTFNTSSVINMGSMFQGCLTLTTLDLSNFNTSNVTSMNSMFAACKKMTSLDISHFDTSKVTNVSWMFSDMYAINTLKLGAFNISSITNKSGMFTYAYASVKIYVKNTTIRTWLINASDNPKFSTSNFIVG